MTKLKECHPKSEITELQLDTEFRQAFTYCNQFNKSKNFPNGTNTPLRLILNGAIKCEFP